MRRIFAIGETTYDIVFRNNRPCGGSVGGSVLNSAVSLGRLKLPVFFLSRFGNDYIGDLSAKFLTENGIDCRYVVRFDGQSRIALAFLDENNNASYQFYQGNKTPRLIYPQVTGEDLIIFGSLNAIKDKGRKELIKFLSEAAEKKTIVMYDPNIRNFSQEERLEVIRKVEENCSMSTILKGSKEDFERLYERADADFLFSKFTGSGLKILMITNGDKPVVLKTANFEKSYPVQEVNVVSAIGAGDNFNAGVIYGLWKNSVMKDHLDHLDENTWDEIIGYGIRFSSEVCSSEENYISIS
jgi:fructokinase